MKSNNYRVQSPLTRTLCSLALVAATVCGSTLSIAADMPRATQVVDTTGGPVQGLVENNIQTFKGIRYGAAPIGELRFLPPQQPEPSKDPIDAIA